MDTMSDRLKDLAKEYLLHTFDFKNGSATDFANEYFSAYDKISDVHKSYSAKAQKENSDKFYNKKR